MKKILLINDFEYEGGAETVFRSTFENLRKQEGIHIEKYVASEKYRRPYNISEYIYSKSEAARLRAKLDVFKPDVIHIHGYYHLLSPSIFSAIKSYKSKFPLKVLYTAHDYHFLYPNSSLLKYTSRGLEIVTSFSLASIIFDRVDHRGFLYSLLKKLQWIIAHKVLDVKGQIDVFISPSEFLKRLYEKELGVKVMVIRNPVDLPSINSSKPILNSDLKLVYFGRIAQEKGLIQFLERLKSESWPYRFDIYGTGDLEDDLKKHISISNLEEKVFYKGFVKHSDLMKILPSYDALVIPSLWFENAPMSIVEGAAQGLCILGSDLGGIKELAKICGNYVLFDVNNKEPILENLKNLKLVERSNRLDVFSKKNYLDEVLNAYN
jgi:glycosyltransferase involved in cell wall biosynthesis